MVKTAMNKMQQIKTKLVKLAELDKSLKLFGSQSHSYCLNPCISPGELNNFESRYGVTLPQDYRQFLLELGNGGAGPGYGLFKLEDEIVTGGNDTEDREYQRLAQPFLLKSMWDGEEENDQNINAQQARQGTIAIATYGCGVDALLVVTGEQRGHIWIDDRSNDGGIYPFSSECCAFYHDDPYSLETVDDTAALSFYDWYQDWLNRYLVRFYAV